MNTQAHITLVGAGPGDPELLTLKALKAIQQANVILYDALVSPEVLAYAQPDALLLLVGKRAGAHSVPQEETNHLLVAYALSHGRVVRLKGGDPMLFARGREEWDYAATFGIPVSVVPGISSLHLPGLYGIPLTHRGTNQGFRVATATGRDGELTEELLRAARTGEPAVVFMGLRKVPQIVAAYRQNGREALPVAVISQGSTPQARVRFATLETLESTLERAPVAAPALLVIGENVAAHPAFAELSALYHTETSLVA